MAESYNPADHTVDEVNAYLKDADDTERQRVLDAEAGAEKPRTGITEGPHAAPADDAPEGEGLATTGNPNDLSTKPDAQVSANIGHQEGAPEELTKVADESAEKGYFGENAEKPDYSQSNPAVMNGGAES